MAPPPDISAPEISVIVPVYHHWDLVPALLDALKAQTLPPARFEVLLVDNDPAALTAHPPLPPNARILPGPAPGSYAARNAGAAQARGALLAFTDADCRPDPGWLAALAAAARQTPSSLLAGPVRMTAPPDAAAAALLDLVRGIPQAAYVSRGYAATANLALAATVFHTLGGFEAARFSGGDAEFCRRAGRAGHPIRLVQGACVAHPARGDWPGLVRKARRIKGGQLTAGPLRRRLAYALRSLAPPLRDIVALARSPHSARRTAIALRLRLWAVEITETARLLTGTPPERR